MALVRPFRALRPPPALAASVASPPYDVINTAEARALAAGNPVSFLRVSRPEVDLPLGTDEHDDAVYAKGAENLARFIADGTLVEDPSPSLYLYRQVMGAHAQVGVVGCVSVDEYVSDTIRKHERTRADKEDDRTRHIDALGAHDEPVFLAYRGDPAIDARVARAVTAAPTYDFVTADGVGHTLWALSIEDTLALSREFQRVPLLYVADGHHRSAASARMHAKRAGTPGEHDVFLAVLFPHDQLQILPYNRLVRDRAGRSPDEVLAALRGVFDVSEGDATVPAGPKVFHAFLGDRWYRLSVRAGSYDARDPVASLDAQLCQDLCLGPLFGITDPRKDKDVDFVGGIRGLAELERRVRDEGWTLAIALHPTRIDDVLAVSDAGAIMPPKSTWFEPKLRSGLFVHRV